MTMQLLNSNSGGANQAMQHTILQKFDFDIVSFMPIL